MGKKILKELKDIVVFAVIVIISVIVIQSYALASTKVQQHSMENTLKENDFLFAEKLSYIFTEPKFGDIIVFLKDRPEGFWGNPIGICIEDTLGKLQRKHPRMRYVKRVIGVPGDRIDIRNGKVFINDKELEEPYIKGITEKTIIDFPIEVHEGELFVLGDNREHSSDSRDFGCVEIDKVEGQVVIRLWPLNKIRVF
ncbi:signal peptidase I [Vallitalea longa]|uniref:Signal peptidase I n=1 Tax=Vallitalea longa TaxID=2936439 RepID=A0A9W5Y8P7_9FIRM|nr:signal peptidase I [Vallitalea longa]GKX27818.1 signal peptidase I [Vallitalea longa]